MRENLVSDEDWILSFVIIKLFQIEVSSFNYTEVNVDLKGNTKQSQYL